MSKPKTGSGWLRGAVLIGWGCETRQKKVDCWAGGPRAVTDGQLSSEPRPGVGHRQRPFASLWAAGLCPCGRLSLAPLFFSGMNTPSSSPQHRPAVISPLSLSTEARRQQAQQVSPTLSPLSPITQVRGRGGWEVHQPFLPRACGVWTLLYLFVCVCA